MRKEFFILMIAVFFPLYTLSAQVDVQVPEGKIQIIDDFENGNYWIWAGFDWDRYSGHKASCGADLSKLYVTQGKYSMELLTESVKQGSNAVWFYDGKQDLSGGKYIVMDIYNASPYSINISFVLQATDNWDWLETPRYSVPSGKHTVVYNVEYINEEFNDVRRININANYDFFYNQDSSLFVDNIRLIK